MKDFMFEIPQSIICGNGCLKQLSSLIAKTGSGRVLIVSDRGLEKIGAVQRVKAMIQESGVECYEYLDVLPNPSVAVCNEVLNMYQSTGCTCMVALGGGSPMDTAKAAGVLASYGGHIIEYEGTDKVPGPIVPIIAIPTTAGTGSEVTAFSVITDEERKYKLTVFSYHIIPRFALLDPEFIMAAPASVAASCGMDALVHAIEAYLSRNASPFTDAMAEKAMELLGRNIRAYVANRQNEDAACAMLLGSNFAGVAFAWSRLGNVHAMSHPVSAIYHVPHGVANAILLPYVLEYNMMADNGRYRKIYRYITEYSNHGDFCGTMLIDKIRELNHAFGIPENLSLAGVKEESLERMAEDAMRSGNVQVNPRATEKKDILKLYRQAMGLT